MRKYWDCKLLSERPRIKRRAFRKNNEMATRIQLSNCPEMIGMHFCELGIRDYLGQYTTIKVITLNDC